MKVLLKLCLVLSLLASSAACLTARARDFRADMLANAQMTPKVINPKILPHEPDYLLEMDVHAWPESKLPLKIFFTPANERDGWDAREADLILKAFSQWLCTQSTLRLTTVNDWLKADIVIRRTGYDELPYGAGGRTLYDFDPKNPTSGKPPLIRTRTNLYCSSANFADLSESEKDALYTLAMHEAGHALGLDGHSSDPDDIMFAKTTNMGLSRRDLATIVHVYPKLPW